MIGVGEIAAPLDLGLRGIQFRLRSQPASGKIVTVGIDDKALLAVGPWPWKRDRFAALTNRLMAAGADRIFYSISFQPLESSGDEMFARSISKYPDRIFLSASMDYRTGETTGTAMLPMPLLAKNANIVSNMKWAEFWNGVSKMKYGQVINGTRYPSIWSALANNRNISDTAFPVDSSYDRSTIPYFSAADIIQPRNTIPELKGKTVLVGNSSNVYGGVLYVLGQGRSADIFVIAMGAETLMQGPTVNWGWIPAWVFAFVVSCICLLGRQPKLAMGLSLVSIGLVFAAPIICQNLRIFIDIAPALILLGATAVVIAWQRFGARKQSQGAINPVSGLPTVNAILHRDQLDPHILVAARISRFTEIVSTMPPSNERDLLEQVVSRLSLGVGRLQLLHGDDGNFFWLMPSEQLASSVDQFKALQLIFRNPISVADKSFTVDIAFGVDQEIDRPLSHRLASALAAARSAADQGTCWKIHDPAANGAQQWALSLLGELDQAIDNGHIWVAYQPKMELATREIIGAEALVRWTHATRGPIGPDEFIQVAERHGRIEKLTAFVLNDAARVGAQALKYDPGFTVSVNISSVLLASRNIIDMVRQALSANGFPATSLVLEVTETAAMAEGRVAIALLEELRDMGVCLSIDDYGTGMSTLEYLRAIPATELKIDKQFSMALHSSAEDQAVMQSTIELAHALGMRVVAEGIETAETQYLLTQMGCEIGQGYHICRPTDWETVLTMIQPQSRIASHG
ncbi:EAL domain-containing protein [Sphingobium sp. BS19]|uniref:EAL domain-containing protein n=1 Tax=Sphingobium sp. BS19 TaxID=3018973 RepID=UPI002492CED5|nr:EAL domain-containing protein [Sphingobium sp. BS19]